MATVSTYQPEAGELAIIRLRPGEAATVLAAAGPVEVAGIDPARAQREHDLAVEAGGKPRKGAFTRYAFVPHNGAEIGWDAQLRSALYDSAPNRVVRGHRLDDAVWADARRLLNEHGAVYVTIREVPYFTRTRFAATVARPAQAAVEEAPDA